MDYYHRFNFESCIRRSGIESLRWMQLYPDDVKALIGNDMTTPLTRDEKSNIECYVKEMRLIFAILTNLKKY